MWKVSTGKPFRTNTDTSASAFESQKQLAIWHYSTNNSLRFNNYKYK